MNRRLIQLNAVADWGGQPRERRRFYSVYGIFACLETENGSNKILEIIEK